MDMQDYINENNSVTITGAHIQQCNYCRNSAYILGKQSNWFYILTLDI